MRQFALAFGFLLMLAALVNLLVDPYRLWMLPHGFDERKPRPRADQHDELVKTRGIARMRPATLILGNSRAEIGLDPLSTAWPPDARPVYNAAVPGAGVGTARDMLAAAIATGRLRRAVIGLDFLDFLVDPDVKDPSPEPPSIERPWQRQAALVFSLDTLYDSASTILASRNADAADITQEGFNPLHEYRAYARQEGYASIFMQKDAANARSYAKQPKALFNASRTSKAWQAFDEIVALCNAAHIDVDFVIYPYHARIIEMFYRAGLTDAFKTWKRELTTRLDRTSGSCRLWDFSGYTEFSTDPVPEPGDKRTITRWYWESGHFKSDLGDLMLKRIFAGGEADFGRCLTKDNVDGVNASLDRGHAQFLEQHPRASAQIARLFPATSP